MTKLNTILLFLFLFSTLYIKGQYSEHYFSDAGMTEGGRIFDHIKGDDYIIIGGSSFGDSKNTPSIIKIDTIGNVIWSTTTFDFTHYNSPNAYIHKLLNTNNGVYATSFVGDWGNNYKEIWKVNPENGNILWKRRFDTGHSEHIQYIIDYDQNKLLIGYCDDYDGGQHEIKMTLINKNNGFTISTHLIGKISSHRPYFGLICDEQKNIYYTKHDTIYKVSSTNLDSIIWKTQHTIADIFDFQQIYIENTDSIFLFGRKDSTIEKGKVICVNKDNGSLLWDLTVPSGDVRCRDYIITDKNIFVTWQHTLHGGGYYSFNATNINKSSGNIKWQSAYKFTGVGLPASHSGGSASATSIDLDRNNNVYLTGYYGDANYGPECWGILKLDSNTGDALYEVTITEDSSYYDDISIGLAACYINDAPYFVGELQTGFEIGNKKSKTTLIKLNEESGKVIRKKYVSGSYQYPSQTQQIEKFGDYNTIILKRLGRRTILELYNVNNNLSWDKLFNSSYLLIPEELSFIDNHTIIFTASGYDKVNTNVLDSIYVYFINKYGLLKETYKFHIGTEYAHPIEILNNGTNSFVFYEKMNNLFYRKIDENGLSSEYDLNININNIITQSKYTVSNSDSTTLIFGMKDYCNRMIELNNTTHDTNDKVCFPDIQQINYVSKSINNSIIICGNDYNDNELIKSINLVTFETNWTNTFTTGKNTLKFVIDEDSSYLYTIGYHDNYSTVRKINPHNGLESWEYLFKEDTFNIESPTDIDYDKNRSHLIITGFTRDGSKELNNSNVVIGIIDTSANIISTYTRSGDFKGENMGICANVLHDGSIWAGGRLNHSEYGKAGFIYELDSGFINGWDENISKPELNNIQIIAYPNPFAEYVNVEFNVPENNSTIILELYNMNGELFYLHQANKVPVGKYNFKINLINNSGLYLLKLQINKSISYQKLIRIE